MEEKGERIKKLERMREDTKILAVVLIDTGAKK
jgi:hypothetical protein